MVLESSGPRVPVSTGPCDRLGKTGAPENGRFTVTTFFLGGN